MSVFLVSSCGVPPNCINLNDNRSIFLTTSALCLRQGEEGPPSLEYIKAKDLFPQKELVKEDESLQVSCNSFHQPLTTTDLVHNLHPRLLWWVGAGEKTKCGSSDYDLMFNAGSWCSSRALLWNTNWWNLGCHCVESYCQDISAKATAQQTRCPTLQTLPFFVSDQHRKI